MNGDHGEPTVSRNRYIAACLTLVAMLALAACTGDSGSTVPTTNVPVTSSTPPVPVPTPPVQEKTLASGMEFAVYFWALFNYAQATLDTAPLDSISDPDCHFCSAAIDKVQKAKLSSSRLDGFDVRVIDFHAPPVKITTSALVITDIEQRPGQVVDATGKATKGSGWKALQTNFALRWDGTTWSVVEIEALTDEGRPWNA